MPTLAYRPTPLVLDADLPSLAPPPEPRGTGSDPLGDLEAACETPPAGPGLAAYLSGAERIAVLVPDGTRKADVPRLLPRLLERIRSLAPAAALEVAIACGAHRPVDASELPSLVGSLEGVKVRSVHAYREDGWTGLGTTSRGTPVALDAGIAAADRLVSLGSVKHHYFAGFGGGPKFLVPGVARIDTLLANHALAFDREAGRIRRGIGPGVLEQNPLHADLREAAAMGPRLFSVHVRLDESGRAAGVTAGEGLPALRAAADLWARTHQGPGTPESYQVILASAGSPPDDTDLVQAHKGIDAAAHWLAPGGSLFFAAALPEGVGPRGAGELLDLGSPERIAERLRQQFELRGIFAWSLLAKARRFAIHLLSGLPPERVRSWGITPWEDPGAFLAAFHRSARGRRAAILPEAGATMPPPLEDPCWIS